MLPLNQNLLSIHLCADIRFKIYKNIILLSYGSRTWTVTLRTFINCGCLIKKYWKEYSDIRCSNTGWIYISLQLPPSLDTNPEDGNHNICQNNGKRSIFYMIYSDRRSHTTFSHVSSFPLTTKFSDVNFLKK